MSDTIVELNSQEVASSSSSSNTIHATVDYLDHSTVLNNNNDGIDGHDNSEEASTSQQHDLDLETQSQLQRPAPCHPRADRSRRGSDFHRFEVLDDDTSTAYSYLSGWSSNYTASNLPGPGRILGNAYEWAGERVFGGLSSGWRERRRRVAQRNVNGGVQATALEEGRGTIHAIAVADQHLPHAEAPMSTPAHSYFSAWSTNYTRSNLPGAGRVLGNLFSSAGAVFERHLGWAAYRLGMGRYAKAEVDFSLMGLFYLKMKKGVNSEEMCDLLLEYARSDNPAIQFMAFKQIVGQIVNSRQPARRLTYEACFRKSTSSRSAVAIPAEAQTFAWKKPGVEYSAGWLHMYRLASLCVLTSANPVMDAIGDLVGRYNLDQRMLEFGEFVDVLARCRHGSDDAIALRFIAQTWNSKGLDAYVQAHGYSHLLLRLAKALRVPYEIASNDPSPFGIGASADSFVSILAMDFMRAMWASLRALGTRSFDALGAGFEEEFEFEEASEQSWRQPRQTHLAVWTEVFVMYCVLRSRVGLQLSPGAVGMRSETWAQECYRELPENDNTDNIEGNRDIFKGVRDKLFELENIHGEAVRGRFPPEDPAVIAETLAKIPK